MKKISKRMSLPAAAAAAVTLVACTSLTLTTSTSSWAASKTSSAYAQSRPGGHTRPGDMCWISSPAGPMKPNQMFGWWGHCSEKGARPHR
jgi:hypothetical protein